MLRSALAPRKQRLLDDETFRRVVTPADGADSGNQPDPVGGEDEDEDRAEEPERPLHQVRADDAFEQPVDAFDQPLEKVLRAARDLRHPPGRHLREDDQAGGDDPRHDHRVRDWKPERPADLDRTLRKAVLHRRGEREEDDVGGAHSAHACQHGSCHARPASGRRTAAPIRFSRSAARRGGSTAPARASSGIPDVLRDAGGIRRCRPARPSRTPCSCLEDRAAEARGEAGTAAAVSHPSGSFGAGEEP